VRTNDGDVSVRIMTSEIVQDTVKGVVTASSVITHLKNNRIEYLACTILLHLVGATNYAFDKVSGVCV
jgi:hypothetical protein